MQTSLKTKHIPLTDAMEAYIAKKLVMHVHRASGGGDIPAASLVIEIGKNSRHHRKGAVWQADATLQWGKEVLRAETVGENFQETVDLLEDELVREINTFKGKRSATNRRGARRAKKNVTIAKAARFYRKGRIREEGR